MCAQAHGACANTTGASTQYFITYLRIGLLITIATNVFFLLIAETDQDSGLRFRLWLYNIACVPPSPQLRAFGLLVATKPAMYTRYRAVAKTLKHINGAWLCCFSYRLVANKLVESKCRHQFQISLRTIVVTVLITAPATGRRFIFVIPSVG